MKRNAASFFFGFVKGGGLLAVIIVLYAVLAGCADIDPEVQKHNDCTKTGLTSEQCTEQGNVHFCKANPLTCKNYCAKYPAEKVCQGI